MDISKFYTFFQQGYPGSTWSKDRNLERNLARLLKQRPDLNNELALLQYFCEAVQQDSDPLALQHLCAYLEPACLLTARKLASNFNINGYSFSDYLQLARKQLLEPKTNTAQQGFIREVPYIVWLCLEYNPKQSNITTYASLKLRSVLLSQLFKHQETARLSDWALLKNSSKKALITALAKTGISEAKIQRCLGAWQGFCAVYGQVTVPQNRKLPEPTEAQWMAIFQYFSEQNFTGDIPEVKNLLKTCVQVLRERNLIQIVSLDGVDESVQEKQELEMVEQWQYQQLEWEEKEALEARDRKLIHFLGRAIATLPKNNRKKSIDPRKLVILYYSFPGLNETKIGYLFGVNQSTISRYLAKHQTSILESMAQWCQKEWGLPLTVENNHALSETLEIRLKDYCRNRVVFCVLRRSLKCHPDLKTDLKLLSNYFGNLPEKLWNQASELEFKPSELNNKVTQLNQGCEKNGSTIAGAFHCTEIELQDKLQATKAKLSQQLQYWVKETFGLTEGNLDAIAEPSRLLVDTFLHQADYAILEQERR
jgi:predicted transcriptional regulator